MTYIVKDECIKCKLTDCVEVCPVDCFYEGENMLMTSDDQYETFWYDLKLPDLAEENDTSKDKIGELNNINNFTKDGWKLISIIPFSIKKNNKEKKIKKNFT